MKTHERFKFGSLHTISFLLMFLAATFFRCGGSVGDEDGDTEADENDLTQDEDVLHDGPPDSDNDPIPTDERFEQLDGLESPDRTEIVDAEVPSDTPADSQDAEPDVPSDFPPDPQDDDAEIPSDPSSDPQDDEADAPSDPPSDSLDADADAEEVAWVDADGDGYPVGEDCDDSDPEIIPGSVRSCISPCDYGTQTCLAGAWTPCSAQTVCSCSNPGETQIIDCGRCGQSSRTCTAAYTWSTPSACFAEGECFAGALDEQPCSFCGKQSRFCNSSCAWLPWTTCDHPGECTPGIALYETTGCPQGSIRWTVCTEDCLWAIDVCTNACPGSPRTGGYYEEICIPGGPFLMGCLTGDTWCNVEERPQHTVYLTPYYIDKYEVTNDRYRACVDAGVCQAPSCSGNETFYDPGTGDWAVQCVNYYEATTFCQWDGGRTLLTEAQWEKAARGPDPRDPRYPWGDTGPTTCEEYMYNWCPQCSINYLPGLVGETPLDVSYYGVYDMLGNASELVKDYYGGSYYSTSPHLDPLGPEIGMDIVVRGLPRCGLPTAPRITIRRFEDEYTHPTNAGFRCARPAMVY
jgi:formylglycine-generating enzyme required for sulfatase activity